MNITDEELSKLPSPEQPKVVSQEEWDAHRFPELAKLKEALGKLESLDASIPDGEPNKSPVTTTVDMIDRWHLETVESYFANCSECRKATDANADWCEAAAFAMDEGWRVIETEIYCKDCIPLVLQRIQEAMEDK